MFSLNVSRIFDLQVLISYQLSLWSFRKSTRKLFGLLRTTQRNPYLCILTLLQDPLIQYFLLMWPAWVTNAMVPKSTFSAQSSHLTQLSTYYSKWIQIRNTAEVFSWTSRKLSSSPVSLLIEVKINWARLEKQGFIEDDLKLM